MRRRITAWGIGVCLAASSLGLVAADEQLLDSAAAQKLFADPPREYATAPLWVWNDMLTEEQIRGTLRDLAGQKVKQAFVHPRPGLMTPYLSDEWFRLWKVALDEAEKLDMNMWIYDENSYPSGFAGGHVPEADARVARPRAGVPRGDAAPKLGPDIVAVYRVNGDAVRECHATGSRKGETLPDGPYLVASVVRAGNSPWHGDRCYVDLMYPGVTEKFLEVTLDAYKKRDRRPVRQARPGCVHRRAQRRVRPADCRGPTTCRPRSRSGGATTCWITCPACVGRSATGSRSATITSRSSSSSTSSTGASRTTNGATKNGIWRSPAITGITSGPTAWACRTTWR